MKSNRFSCAKLLQCLLAKFLQTRATVVSRSQMWLTSVPKQKFQVGLRCKAACTHAKVGLPSSAARKVMCCRHVSKDEPQSFIKPRERSRGACKHCSLPSSQGSRTQKRRKSKISFLPRGKSNCDNCRHTCDTWVFS